MSITPVDLVEILCFFRPRNRKLCARVSEVLFKFGPELKSRKKLNVTVYHLIDKDGYFRVIVLF